METSLDKNNRLLEQIVKNTSSKEQYQIIVSNDKSNFFTPFDKPFELDPSKRYEVALVKLFTYFSFPNIDEKNNTLEYTKGEETKRITIPTGAYGLKGLNKAINAEIKALGDDNAISLQPNLNTMKTVLLINPGYVVKLNNIRKILGFEKNEYPSGIHISENVVDIFPVSSIFVRTDLSDGSLVNNSKEPVIYAFFPKVNPGYKIIETPNNPIYLPINVRTINNIHIRFTDQESNLLDLRGEKITIVFHIREY